MSNVVLTVERLGLSRPIRRARRSITNSTPSRNRGLPSRDSSLASFSLAASPLRSRMATVEFLRGCCERDQPSQYSRSSKFSFSISRWMCSSYAIPAPCAQRLRTSRISYEICCCVICNRAAMWLCFTPCKINSAMVSRSRCRASGVRLWRGLFTPFAVDSAEGALLRGLDGFFFVFVLIFYLCHVFVRPSFSFSAEMQFKLVLSPSKQRCRIAYYNTDFLGIIFQSLSGMLVLFHPKQSRTHAACSKKIFSNPHKI
jgi:hypothetical protein